MDGKKYADSNPCNVPAEELTGRGVKFGVGEITRRHRKLDRKLFLPEVTFVPSGVAEIARLQQREGYAYLRP